MNGRVLVNPPIAVDYWNLAFCHNVDNFFLTHMHSDHTHGLSSTWSRPLFCSVTTKKLIIHKFQIYENCIQAMETNESRIIILNAKTGEVMKVTLLDANHCPGSAMFHFEGKFGQILYTGDFRYSEEICKQITKVIPHLKIDRLYLDDTFWNCQNNLPPREEAINEVLEIIENHPGCKILIALYTIGKEYLLETISQKLDTSIYVTQARMRILEIIKCKGRFVTDRNASDIHVLGRHHINKELRACEGTDRTIVIVPSGFDERLDPGNDRIFIVPLSDHSSRAELKAFISFLHPKHVFGLTNYTKKNKFPKFHRGVKLIPQHISKSLGCSHNPTIISESPHPKSGNNFLFHKIPRLSLDYAATEEQNQDKMAKQPPLLMHERLEKFRTKALLVKCFRCNKRFPEEDLKYNRNKDQMYDPGLCSRCDVVISQASEKEALRNYTELQQF